MASHEYRPEHQDVFAAFYDALHPEAEDLDFFRQLLAGCKGRILELGSGTGRILLPLARDGHHVTGVEQSGHMLSICRAKAAQETAAVRRRITLAEGDVRQYWTEERYAFILAPCNFLSYFAGSDDLLRLLEIIAGLLADGGCFAVVQSMPDLQWMTANNGRTHEVQFPSSTAGCGLLLRFSVHYDFAEQLEFSSIEIEEYAGERVIHRGTANTTMAFFFPEDLRVRFAQAGLGVAAERGSLTEDIPIMDKSREMVFLCNK